MEDRDIEPHRVAAGEGPRRVCRDSGLSVGQPEVVPCDRECLRDLFNAEARSSLLQAVFLSGLFVFAALPSCFLWLAFGATIQRILYNQRRLRVFNVTMGALLALSIVLILR